MNIDASPPDLATSVPRGGFWRRWLATVIDCLLVILPFQILAAVLFNLTAGMIQMDGGIYSFCAPTPIEKGVSHGVTNVATNGPLADAGMRPSVIAPMVIPRNTGATVLAMSSWSVDHHAEIRLHQAAYDSARRPR